MLSGLLLEGAFDLDSQGWQSINACLPEDVEVDVKIGMLKTISYPDDIPTGYIAVVSFCLFAQLPCSLADDLDCLDQGPCQLAIGFELFALATACEPQG